MKKTVFQEPDAVRDHPDRRIRVCRMDRSRADVSRPVFQRAWKGIGIEYEAERGREPPFPIGRAQQTDPSPSEEKLQFSSVHLFKFDDPDPDQGREETL